MDKLYNMFTTTKVTGVSETSVKKYIQKEIFIPAAGGKGEEKKFSVQNLLELCLIKNISNCTKNLKIAAVILNELHQKHPASFSIAETNRHRAEVLTFSVGYAGRINYGIYAGNYKVMRINVEDEPSEMFYVINIALIKSKIEEKLGEQEAIEEEQEQVDKTEEVNE